MGELELASGELTYGTGVSKPGEMSGDGGAEVWAMLEVSSAKARRLHAGKLRIT